MFCMRCGTSIPQDGGFCPKCGTSVDEVRAFMEKRAPSAATAEIPAAAVEFTPPQPVDASVEALAATVPFTALTEEPAAVPDETPAVTPADVPDETPAATPADVPDDVQADTPADVPDDVQADTPAAMPADTLPFAAPIGVPTDTPPFPAPAAAPAVTPTDAPSFPAPIAVPTDAPSTSPEKPKKKRGKGLVIGIVAAVVVLIAVGAIVGYNINRSNNYNKAVAMLEAGDYQGAYDAFGNLGKYKDSAAQQELAQNWMDYLVATSLFKKENYDAALEAFKKLGAFEDSGKYIDYINARALYKSENYDAALEAFKKLGGFEDAGNYADFLTARALFKNKDYEAALETFKKLGTFEGANTYADSCEKHISYNKAISDYDNGKYEQARKTFNSLKGNADFPEAKNWALKCSYALADILYQAGDMYEAYWAFMDIISFEDSEARARQCTTAFPGTGTLYFNPSYASSRSAITINATNANYVSYFKIYNGATLVATLWLNPGTRHTVELAPSSYTVKQASGDVWFGETIMFGDEGYYEVLIFDGGLNYFDLGDNIEMTLTLQVADGNTGSNPTKRENF